MGTKKKYTAPAMEICDMTPQVLLTSSGVESNGYGIGYGGVDEYGEMDVD